MRILHASAASFRPPVAQANNVNTLHDYVFDMADGGRFLGEKLVMPESSGAVPGEFFVFNPKYQARASSRGREQQNPFLERLRCSAVV